MNAAAWDAAPTPYQADLLLAALADTRHRIPSNAKGRTLDIMYQRQWIKEYTADGRLASTVRDYPGFAHFRLTHHGLNAARKAKAKREGEGGRAQAGTATAPAQGQGGRCAAAHPADPAPCDGPVAVTVLDADRAGADGCEGHASRLLASLDQGHVYALPSAPAGAAIRVFRTAASAEPLGTARTLREIAQA